MRALVIALVIAGCGWSGAKQKQRRTKYDPPEDLPVKRPVDPIEALLPTDDDNIAWLVPGRIQLEAGGATIEAPGGNRPIEVKLIDEQGSMARLALQLDHVRFSVWSDRTRLLAVLLAGASLAPFAGGGGAPSTMAMHLFPGARVKRLARKDAWRQVRYIGTTLSAEGWVHEVGLGSTVPRSELRAGRPASGYNPIMLTPGTVIRAEPKWTGRQLAVAASNHIIHAVHERGDGWTEVRYVDREVRVQGYVSKRDPPGRAHRFTDPETPLAAVAPNTKVASGTCLYARPDGEPIGYIVGDRDVELLAGGKHGWWSVAVDSPWGPIAFAARGPDGQSLERCAPDGSVPAPVPPGPPAPSVP